MQDRLLFVISPPGAGSHLLQRMLASHSQVLSQPDPQLITPLAFLGYYDLVDRAPYDHVGAAEAIKAFVASLPRGEADYLDALRAYADTLYGRMLDASGKRYFLDTTAAYALVLPFLTRVYPDARYLVLTRHPLAVASAYANGFFDGDWQAATEFDPIVNRYLPAIARLLRDPPSHLLQVGYESLVRDPANEFERILSFLGLASERPAIDPSGAREGAPSGTYSTADGEPTSPTDSSIDAWVAELARDPKKLELASEIVAALAPSDVAVWGFDASQLLAPVEAEQARGHSAARATLRTNAHGLQRRLVRALRKDIRQRPHGKVVEKLRHYCNVLLRE